MTNSFINKIRPIIITILYSLIFLLSEYIYRSVFNIPTMRNLAESYTIIFAFVILMLLAKSRIISFLIWTFFTISIIANNLHYEFYQSWVNATNYLLFFTEIHEVTHVGVTILPKLIVPFTWGLFESLLFASLIFFKRKRTMIADIIFVVALVFICVRSYSTTQQHAISPNPDYSRLKVNYFTLGYFIGKTLPYHLFSLSNVPTYSHPEPKVIAPPKVKNIIFVVGESQNTQHMSTFGYERQTTPFMSKFIQQHNALLKPTYSAGVMTAIALPTLFNAIERPNGLLQINSGKTNLFHLAKNQNYITSFHSAQAEREMMIMNIIGQKWIDSLTFPSSEGYTRFEHMRDDQLLPYLQQADLDSHPNFLILHQRGSHSPYGEKLHDDEKPFGSDNVLDNYDNTIYHTDQLLKSVMTQLESRHQDDWLLVFTSDHGQFVDKDSFNQGLLNEQSYSVPVFIYTPNAQLQNEINQKLVDCEYLYHQQLSTLLIWLMGYDMPISDCKTGFVNSNLLSGDNGYQEINQQDNTIRFIFPNKK